MYSLSKDEREQRVAEVLKTVGLEQQREWESKGLFWRMLRRLEIARGMLTSPKVLLLRRTDDRAGRADATIPLGLPPTSEQGDRGNCSLVYVVS